jgi:hypothetical protein
MKRQIGTLIIYLLFSIISSAQITINLDEALLNDSVKIRQLNLNSTSNIFGRPSAVENNDRTAAILEIEPIFGNKIFYHNLGLSFEFHPKIGNAEPKVKNVNLFLSKTWDEENNEFFMPFSGTLKPQINANMKIEDLLLIFNKDSSDITTAQEEYDMKRKLLKGGLKNMVPRGKYDYFVIKKDKYRISLKCEEVTKYLEYITLNFLKMD